MTTKTIETTETPTPAASAPRLDAVLADLRRALGVGRDLVHALPDPAGDLVAEAESEVAANPRFAPTERECDVLWRRVRQAERAVEALDAALVAAARCVAAAETVLAQAPATAPPATAADLKEREAREAARREAEAAIDALHALPDEARATRRVLVLTGAALARAAATVTGTRATAAAERIEERLRAQLAAHREATEREAAEVAAAVRRWAALAREARR